MIVLITEAAEADLEAIGDWIAVENPARARRLRRCRRRQQKILRHPDTANFSANSAASTTVAGESWEKRPAINFAST